MVNELEALRNWYTCDTGVARVKKFIFGFYEWNSILEEPRTPWQVRNFVFNVKPSEVVESVASLQNSDLFNPLQTPGEVTHDFSFIFLFFYLSIQ